MTIVHIKFGEFGETVWRSGHSAADVLKWMKCYIRFSPAFRFLFFKVEAFYNEKSSSERSRSGPSVTHLTFDSKTHMFRNTFFAKSHRSIGFVRQYRSLTIFHIKLNRFSDKVSRFRHFSYQTE